jgi:PAS domain S-box-containing protein
LTRFIDVGGESSDQAGVISCAALCATHMGEALVSLRQLHPGFLDGRGRDPGAGHKLSPVRRTRRSGMAYVTHEDVYAGSPGRPLVIELSAYEFSALRDGPFTLSRGHGDGLAPILLVAPAGDYPARESLERLEHEYALRTELDADWAARPVELLRREVRPTLVLEDHGGMPLEQLLGQPLEIAQFLRIAIPLAAALGQVHARGLIHKDVKPANILVDLARVDAGRGGVWLTGFGIASRLPREHQTPAPPEVIAGTLAYMAPEQTGRMNRSIDLRSDLYSVGVTFYEMLTGTLPFTASDPMEWVHCHIARQPVPPAERVAGIPRPLSAIVLKLLAKSAEDRYQTAVGLTFDLRRCLADWESFGRIESFPLGSQDASDRLLITEQLYGREREIDVLLSAFDRVVATSIPELVLVSGYSGIGKSSVVHELQKVLVPSRGLFAAGKFDQYKRDIPYATLAQAFQSLVRPLLGQSETELGRWRDALRDALDQNGQLLVNLVPELELVIGKQPPVQELPPQDAQHRFQLMFRRLIGVFARPEHPLVLFLDDLQWLDAATLSLLEHLITHADVRHLLVVGAYRDNEVGPAHPLMRSLAAVRASGARIHEILLAPLDRNDVGRLIADALHCEPTHAEPLARLVHEKTGGNPFFAIQFFTGLAEDGLLAFDPVTLAWHWDIARIRARSYTDNVVELMAGKLTRLPDETQHALQQLACLGNVVEVTTLTLVLGKSEADIHAALWDATRAGLILRQESAYAFPHDRIQQAAYSLIPDEHRADLHLRIGRVLLASMTAGQLAEHLFDVANQFNRGKARLVDRDEKAQVAMIDLRAGRRAKASAAYTSACVYLTAGMALLDERDWDSQFALTFSLWLERAECEYLSGNFDRAEQLIGKLLARATSNVDQAAVFQVKLLLHTVKSEYPQAVASGLTCLRLFGIDLPAHPTLEQVRAEYETLWQSLNGRSIESLIDLPLMTDPELQAAMQVISVLTPPAYFTDFHLFCLLACRMATISMQHGISDASTSGYALLGFILGPVFHRYGDGYRFATLACELVEKHGFVAQAKIYHATGQAAFWTRPIATAIDLMQATFRTAIETGNLTLACFSMYQVVGGLLLRNDPLDAVWRESEIAVSFARVAGYEGAVDMIRSQQRFIATMQGRTASFSSLRDTLFGEAASDAHLTADRMPLAVCLSWILLLKARFLSGDYAEALAAADEAKPLLSFTTAQIQQLDYFYYAALAVAALYENASADEQTAWRELLAMHREQLHEWAETYPPTFGDKHALVSAEIARLDGRDTDAMHLYEDAIRSARANGFVHNEGVALEVAARFYAARGLETTAHAYRRNARDCYRRWGAAGKVRQLERLHPELREDSTPAPATEPFGTSDAQLDVGAVVKASHAISGEIVLGRLIETLMTIALEHAGAERGLLILLRGDAPRIEAEARIDRKTVAVTLRQDAVTSHELPESLLHTVLRTRESVILDDASAPNPFSADAYIRESHVRSVLCLPLMKQATLIGVLYLENNLASHVFTPARISVLELLSSQAAISLENARLYADLLTENRDRQTAEDALRASEERWRNLFESAPVGIALTGSQGYLAAVNPAFQRMVGYSEAELVGRSPAEITHEDDRDVTAAIIGAHSAGQSRTPRFEKRYRRKDGGVIWAESSLFLVPVPGRTPILGAVVVDITDRKRAEEELRGAQAELTRVARLTTMGEFAASIAHEINQPLAAIVMSGSAGLRWLSEERPDLAEAREAFTRVVSDGRRAGEVIRGLRALAQKSGPQLTTLDINDVIRDVLALTQSELQRHGVVLRTDLAASDRLLQGDPVQLQQVLLNLILNGIDAMKGITDRARELTVSSALAEPHGVLVLVEDTGTGLDPAIAHRIFEPMFTTKADGLGMGLAICRSIIEAHGGQLSLAPHAPHGTALRFTLPRSHTP